MVLPVGEGGYGGVMALGSRAPYSPSPSPPAGESGFPGRSRAQEDIPGVRCQGPAGRGRRGDPEVLVGTEGRGGYRGTDAGHYPPPPPVAGCRGYPLPWPAGQYLRITRNPRMGPAGPGGGGARGRQSTLRGYIPSGTGCVPGSPSAPLLHPLLGIPEYPPVARRPPPKGSIHPEGAGLRSGGNGSYPRGYEGGGGG